jgi:hypothetical protein
LESTICKPCTNDITKVIEKESFVPRWQKIKLIQANKPLQCNIVGCDEFAKHNSNISCRVNFDSTLVMAGLELKSADIPSVIPLCNHHYHEIYKVYQPTQTHCVTCNMWLKRSNTRHCPSPHIVQTISRDTTDYDGQIQPNDKVCFSCYKSHLAALLQSDKSVSTSNSHLSLAELICGLSASLPSKRIVTLDDLVDNAMIRTTIDVGNTLLSNEAILLPNIHDIYNGHIRSLVQSEGLEDSLGKEINDNLVTSRWVLIQLSITLNNHMASTCKVLKCGTLVYRKDADFFLVVTRLLWKLKSNDVAAKSTQVVNVAVATSPKEPSVDAATSVLSDLNNRIHTSIRSLLAEEAKTPYDYSKLDIHNFLENIDPQLWNAICHLTKSFSEHRGISKVADETSITPMN